MFHDFQSVESVTRVGAILLFFAGPLLSSAPLSAASRFRGSSPPSMLGSTSDSRRGAKLPMPLTELLALCVRCPFPEEGPPGLDIGVSGGVHNGILPGTGAE